MKFYILCRIIYPDDKCEIVLASIGESVDDIRIRLQVPGESLLELVPVLVLNTGDYLRLRKEAITNGQ